MKKELLILMVAALCSACGTTANLSSTDSAEGNAGEEMIDVGYGKIRKSKNTYATSTLKLSDNEASIYTNMYDYLRGRVAGVEVRPDNSIVIRGIGSINSSTDPLIMLDGVPIFDLSTVNPMDVESVTVLKDSSTAMYGMRGANGVILITTKHGKSSE